jgi:hypothetical protein
MGHRGTPYTLHLQWFVHVGDLVPSSSVSHQIFLVVRRRGRAWAQHVLETPRAWILCAVYITFTVTWASPPFLVVARTLLSLGDFDYRQD